MSRRWWGTVLVCVACVTTLEAQPDPRTIMQEYQKRTQAESQQYEGSIEVMDGKNRVSTKRWQYERIGSHGRSRTVLRFVAPPEVKGVALLVENHVDRASDQWMWTPAIQRERRIAMQDRSTRFFGTDFSFEDLEERDIDQFDFRLLGEEIVEGAPCWKIESRPRPGRSSQYVYSHLWIRKDNYVFARIENFGRDGLVRRARYSQLTQIQGIWTPQEVEMTDIRRNSRTLLRIEKLRYNVPLKPESFTLQALRRAS